MPGARDGQPQRVHVDRAVQGGGERGLGEVLVDQTGVEPAQRLGGVEQTVTVAAGQNLLGLKRLLDEHRKQCSGDAVADGVGEVEPDVALVQPHHVIQIAADVAGRAEERVEPHRTDLRQRLGQKVLLEPRGQPQLLVDPPHVGVEGVVAAADEFQLLANRLELALHRLDLPLEQQRVECFCWSGACQRRHAAQWRPHRVRRGWNHPCQSRHLLPLRPRRTFPPAQPPVAPANVSIAKSARRAWDLTRWFRKCLLFQQY